MTFEVYLDDDRYSVLQLVFITAGSDADARAAAHRLLIENRHYRGIELRKGDEPVVVLQKPPSDSVECRAS